MDCWAVNRDRSNWNVSVQSDRARDHRLLFRDHRIVRKMWGRSVSTGEINCYWREGSLIAILKYHIGYLVFLG